MKEETYLKAKVIMDRVEELRGLKEFRYPTECYSISFTTNTGVEKTVGLDEIGTSGRIKMFNTYAQIIDDLISEQLKKLEEIKE